MLFGAAYYPEHRDPARWDYDLDNMARAGVNAIRVAEFAWIRLEPAEGNYDFSWLDTVLEKAGKRGIRLIMCPPLRTLPAWLVEKDPSLLIEDLEGRRLEFGSRYTFCINHPLLREKGFALARAMAARYGGNENVAGWHLDNEFGCDKDCHCPICREKWQGYLASRYGSIEELNRRWGNVFWGLEYDSFSQVPTPRISHAAHSPAQLQAWRQFRSDCTAEVVRLHAECVRPHAAGRFISTNCQSPYANPTDYFEMAKALDVCGTNYYPGFGDGVLGESFRLAGLRGYKPGEHGFHVFELRSGTHPVPGMSQATSFPGAVEQLTAHAVANGAEGIFYFRWRMCPFGAEQAWGSVTGYDGQPGRVFREVAETRRKLKAIEPLLEGTSVESEVAVLWDYPGRWSLDSGWVLSRPPNLACRSTEDIYQSLRELGLNCDAVGRAGRFDEYRLIVIPVLPLVDDDLVMKLTRFVEEGGTLVGHPFTGTKNMDCEVYPERMHPGLERLFGVNVSEYVTLGREEEALFNWKGRRFKARDFFDLPRGQGARARAEFLNGWCRGVPAVTESVRGRGRAFYVSAFAGPDFRRSFLDEVCRTAGVAKILPGKAPEGVEVTERRGPDGRRIVFLVNATSKKKTLRIGSGGRDVWNGRKAGGSIALLPRGVSVIAYW